MDSWTNRLKNWRKGFNIQDSYNICENIDFEKDSAKISLYFQEGIESNSIYGIYRSRNKVDINKVLSCPSSSVDVKRFFTAKQFNIFK